MLPVLSWLMAILAKETKILLLQVEAELTELPSEERVEYLTSLGVSESGLGNLIRSTYSLLGLRTYFTSGEKVSYIILDSNFFNTILISLLKKSAFMFFAGNKSLDYTCRLAWFCWMLIHNPITILLFSFS